jgi:hypothetical protein
MADAIAAADDAAELGAVTWSVTGPTQLSFDGLVDAVHGTRVAKRHLGTGDGEAGGRWVGAGAAGSGPWLREVQAGVLALDSLGDPALPAPPGLVPTPLAEALARSAAGEWSRVAGPA